MPRLPTVRITKLKLFAAFSVFLLLGCAGEYFQYVPKTLTIADFDLRQYTAKGFLFTPYPYSGEYEPVGMVSAVISPEANLEPIGNNRTHNMEWKINAVDAHEALDSLYHIAASHGANAIASFTLTEFSDSYNNTTTSSYPVIVRGYRVSGFAIKRAGR